jgi:phosphoglycerate dehydrogenase-like enzyme
VPPLTLLVVARPDDPGRALVDRLPPGVRAVVGSTAGELAAAAPEADAALYCSGGQAVLRELWPALARLRWLHSRSAGVDALLFPELVESDVTLTNSRGVFGLALGEWVLAAVLYFAKDLARLRRSQAQGRWDPFEPQLVRGRTAGILGLGDVGRACARALRGAGLVTLGVRRRAPDAASARAGRASAGDPDLDEVLPASALEDLLARSDYVVLALPLTAQTRGLIDARALSALRSEAVLINVGRGALVDDEALVDALRAGRLRGAALDVFAQEPLPSGHPYYALDSVLLSPHCADQVAGWREAAQEVFLRNLERVLAGRPPQNVVDKRGGY